MQKNTLLTLFLILVALSLNACLSDNRKYEPTGFSEVILWSYKDLVGDGLYSNSKNLKKVRFTSTITKSELIQCLEHPHLLNIEDLDLNNIIPSSGGQGPGSLTTDDLTRLLPRFKHLKKLNLTKHGYVDFAVLEQLVNLKNLTSLNVSECQRINDEDLQIVSEMYNLTELELSGIGSTTMDGVQHLSRLTRLSKLALGRSRQINLAIILDLQNMTELTDLTLEGIDLTLPDEATLQSQLETIRTVTSRLRKLNLSSNAQITDRHLYLIGTQFELRQLTDLNLAGVGPITATGLRHLYNLQSLRRLEIDYGGIFNRSITRSDVNELLGANPNLDASLLFKNQLN